MITKMQLNATKAIILATFLSGCNSLPFVQTNSQPSTPAISNKPPSPAKVEVEPSNISGSLATNLKKVFAIGSEVGNPETLQAILLQESSGGSLAFRVGNKASPVGKRSYGLMQVQVVAARSVLQHHSKLVKRYFPTRRYKDLVDEEIIALLLSNDEANIRIAAHHFDDYLKLAKGNWSKAVMGYNAGIGFALKSNDHDNFEYVKNIKIKIASVVHPFNTKNGLI